MIDGALTNLAYDDLPLGTVGAPLSVKVDSDLAAQLAGPLGTRRPVERLPAGVLPVLFLRAVRSSLGGIPAGAILAKQTLRYVRAVPLPTVVTVTTEVEEKVVRRGRPFVRFRFAVRGPDGDLIGSGSKTMVWPSGPAIEEGR